MLERILNSNANRRACVFLDKDGTLLEDVPYNVEPADMRFAPGAAQALKVLASLGMPLVVVANQPGVALGRFPIAALTRVETLLRHMFRSCGAVLDGFYYCPHHPEGRDEHYRKVCGCRKPRAGMLLQAGAALGIDLARSWMIGDTLDDVEAGRRAGCRTMLVGADDERISNRAPLRMPHYIARNLEEAAHDVAHAEVPRVVSAPIASFASLYPHCAAAGA